jgi:hypothetical protein
MVRQAAILKQIVCVEGFSFKSLGIVNPQPMLSWTTKACKLGTTRTDGYLSSTFYFKFFSSKKKICNCQKSQLNNFVFSAA